MNRAVVSALVAVVITCPVVAQEKPIAPPVAPAPPARSNIKPNQLEVVISGCIRGNRLQLRALASDPQVDALRASEFILEGPRELMQQIRRAHGGHYDEIAGIVTVPPPPPGDSSEVSAKKLGPVSVKMGSRSESSPVKEAPRPLRLKVASLTHLDEQCVSAR